MVISLLAVQSDVFAVTVILRRPNSSICCDAKTLKKNEEVKKKGEKCARAAAGRRVDHSPWIIYPPCILEFMVCRFCCSKECDFFLLVFFFSFGGQMFASD